MRLAFETANLYPSQGGVYTYASQLLWRLMRLAEPPDITLVDGLRHRDRDRLIRDLADLPDEARAALSTTRYVKARRLPVAFLSSIDGPWMRHASTRHLATHIDKRVVMPYRQWLHGVPLVARWALPRDMLGRMDVFHWSDGIFFRVPGAAHVMTVLDTIPLNHPEWCTREQVAYHTRKLRLIARYATRVIAISEHTRRDIVRLLGIPTERIDVIPLGVGAEFKPPTDRGARQAVLARHRLRDGDYILYVGNDKPHKNLARLVAAFTATIERMPWLTTTLVLAGVSRWPNDGDRTVARLGDRLVLPGRVPQEDLPVLLNASRAVAFVSLYEGFGLPPLEAMACGAAVVASNSSSIPEVVGDAGLLVDPYNVDDIATALQRVITDDALRAELIERGLRRAARFSWAKAADMTMETYRRALSSAARQYARPSSGTAYCRGGTF